MFVFVSLNQFYLIGQSGRQEVLVRDKKVVEAAPEASRFGIVSGIPVRLARRRCPGLTVREFRAEDYAERFEVAWSVFAKYTPMIETTDFHQGYLDLTHDVRRFGSAENLLHELAEELRNATGLRFDWGGGKDKWMAWLAREHNQFIDPAMESLVLSKLTVESMSLPERVTERLHHFDIHTVAQVLSLPSGFLESHLGFDREFVLKRLTRHKEPVRPNFPPPEITAAADVSDSDEGAVARAVAQVCQELIQNLQVKGVQATSLKITCQTKSRAIEWTHKLSRTTLSSARLEGIILESLPPESRPILTGIRVQALGLLPNPVRQNTLWEDRQREKSEEQIDRLRSRLNDRYRSNILLSGKEAFERQQPRFAQLVYRTRGLVLP
ncbi:MAG: hypothetical protein H6508_08210 [Calditrichaeota bacterium]|nr:hypothetical protein [Calditrichota bacterium]